MGKDHDAGQKRDLLQRGNVNYGQIFNRLIRCNEQKGKQKAPDHKRESSKVFYGAGV
jgi:hypothetical protein